MYLSLKRAVVTEKDIQDYWSIWKKNRIYVASEYYTEIKKNKTLGEFSFSNIPHKLDNLSFEDFPSKIKSVRFCLKSRKELQKIANRTWEDFLHISFELIKIEDNKATIKINNTWIVSNKHPNKSYLSGGGYVASYEKINGKWQFIKIMSRWIS